MDPMQVVEALNALDDESLIAVMQHCMQSRPEVVPTIVEFACPDLTYPPSSVLTKNRAQGVVKSYHPDNGFGFITCPDLFAVFECDVFVHKAQIGNFGPGSTVSFCVLMNKNKPQAYDLQEVPGHKRSAADMMASTSSSWMDMNNGPQATWPQAFDPQEGRGSHKVIKLGGSNMRMGTTTSWMDMSNGPQAFDQRESRGPQKLIKLGTTTSWMDMNNRPQALGVQGSPGSQKLVKSGAADMMMPGMPSWMDQEVVDMMKQMGMDPSQMMGMMEAFDDVKGEPSESSTTIGKPKYRIPLPGKPDEQAVIGTFTGTIKSFNPTHGYGFIDCPDLKQQGYNDVFVHHQQVGSFQIGNNVQFTAYLNSNGQPRAKDLQIPGTPVTSPAIADGLDFSDFAKFDQSMNTLIEVLEPSGTKKPRLS